MNKIIKYLDSIGIKCIYEGHKYCRHFNGRSFYNDGTYIVKIYNIGNGCKIFYKSTGRPEYRFYKENKYITMRFSQRDFIEYLKGLVL